MITGGPAGGPRRRRQGPDDAEPSVFVANEQVDHPIDETRWQTLVERVLAAENITGDAELSVLFVDEVAITDLNRGFLDGDGPTDVLSFPIDGEVFDSGRWPDGGTPSPGRGIGDPDDLPLLLGDIVVCPAVAHRNAPGHAGSFDDELALLLVHGVLHLLGRDHIEPAQRDAMRARERELLAELWGPLAADPWAALAAEEAAMAPSIADPTVDADGDVPPSEPEPLR